MAEITDNGGRLPGRTARAQVPAAAREVTPAAATPGELRLRRAGSGLAGLTERVRQLGGDLAAGPRQPRLPAPGLPSRSARRRP